MKTGEVITITVEKRSDTEVRVHACNEGNRRVLLDAWITPDQPFALIGVRVSGVRIAFMDTVAVAPLDL